MLFFNIFALFGPNIFGNKNAIKLENNIFWQFLKPHLCYLPYHIFCGCHIFGIQKQHFYPNPTYGTYYNKDNHYTSIGAASLPEPMCESVQLWWPWCLGCHQVSSGVQNAKREEGEGHWDRSGYNGGWSDDRQACS